MGKKKLEMLVYKRPQRPQRKVLKKLSSKWQDTQGIHKEASSLSTNNKETKKDIR